MLAAKERKTKETKGKEVAKLTQAGPKTIVAVVMRSMNWLGKVTNPTAMASE